MFKLVVVSISSNSLAKLRKNMWDAVSTVTLPLPYNNGVNVYSKYELNEQRIRNNLQTKFGAEENPFDIFGTEVAEWGNIFICSNHSLNNGTLSCL